MMSWVSYEDHVTIQVGYRALWARLHQFQWLSLSYMFASSILGMLFLRGAYFGPRRTSTMELFANIVYGFLLLTIFTKSFVIDVWQDLNPLNVKMIKQTQKSSGPFCGVGPKRVRWASGPCLVAILFFL